MKNELISRSLVSNNIWRIFIDSRSQVWILSGKKEIFLCRNLFDPHPLLLGTAEDLVVAGDRIAIRTHNNNLHVGTVNLKSLDDLKQIETRRTIGNIALKGDLLAFETQTEICVLDQTNGLTQCFPQHIVGKKMVFLNDGKVILLLGHSHQWIDLIKNTFEIIRDRDVSDFSYFDVCESNDHLRFCLAGDSLELFDRDRNLLVDFDLRACRCDFLNDKHLVVRLGGKPDANIAIDEHFLLGYRISIARGPGVDAIACDRNSPHAAISYGGYLHVVRFS